MSEATILIVSINISNFLISVVLICLDLYLENIILLKICVLYFHVFFFLLCLFQSWFTEVIFLSGKGEVTYFLNLVQGLVRWVLMTAPFNFQMRTPYHLGARCSSVVRAFAHGVMGRRIDPSWGGPIELFLALASAPRLV